MIEYRVRYKASLRNVGTHWINHACRDLDHAQAVHAHFDSLPHIEEVLLESRFVSPWVVR